MFLSLRGKAVNQVSRQPGSTGNTLLVLLSHNIEDHPQNPSQYIELRKKKKNCREEKSLVFTANTEVCILNMRKN